MRPSNEDDSRGANILIVDDDRPLLWALSSRLSKIGYRCITCGNASEAMVQFAVRSFDLVITDLTMPGIDGLSVVAMIRSQSAVPILVVTGHSREYGSLLANYENVKLIGKPLDPQTLVDAVRGCLGGAVDLESILKCA
jgi:DNA-binding response OmpR family regulator